MFAAIANAYAADVAVRAKGSASKPSPKSVIVNAYADALAARSDRSKRSY